MNSKQWTGLAAGIAAASVLATGSASAQVTQTQYEAQYQDATTDLLRLDYSTWSNFNALVNGERDSLDALDLPAVDLSALSWSGGVQDVEVYFINEGAGYRNQLYYSVDSGDSKEVVFDDVSSPLSILPNYDGPLSLGQGVSLGNFTGETFIDFFLKSNGANGGSKFLGFDPTQNSDGLQHILGYNLGEYVLLGFEDIVGGGDLDYNDTVFVVKGVTAPPADVPEPAALLGLLGIGSLLGLRRR